MAVEPCAGLLCFLETPQKLQDCCMREMCVDFYVDGAVQVLNVVCSKWGGYLLIFVYVLYSTWMVCLPFSSRLSFTL